MRLLPILLLTCLVLAAGPALAAEEGGAAEGGEKEPQTDASQGELEDSQRELADKRKELEELEAEIETLKGKQQSAASQAKAAEEQVRAVTQRLRAAQLRLERTVLTLSLNRRERDRAEEEIKRLRERIQTKRQHLRYVIRSLYLKEQASFIDIILGSGSLGELLAEQRTYHELQKRTVQLIRELRADRQELERKQQALEQRKQELDRLRGLQVRQQAELNDRRLEKQDALRFKEQQRVEYKRQVQEAQAARQEIEQEIFTLRSIGLELALNDAYDAARYAGGLTGTRPSLLLAIVKVETNVGQWLGSGVFPEDMHPASRDAFLRLAEKLGLDPYDTPISRRPTSYQGWGGAIGPGQFMPDTWERLEPRVKALLGRQPNPFELADALVGIGIMMADRGAVDPSRELEAVSRYLAGPNWQYHTWYGRKVLAVAEEYAKEGL